MDDNTQSSSEGHTENNTETPNQAVPQTVPDTTVFAEETGTYRTTEDKICIGILYCKEDAAVATRFKDKFESNAGVKALRFHDDYTAPPGDPKVDEIADFCQYCNAFIWLATENSIKHDLMNHYRAVSHHLGLTRRDKIFMCGIAAENLNIKLPATLDAYSPIKEDERFTQCVQNTVGWLVKKVPNSCEVTGTSQQQRPVDEHAASMHLPHNVRQQQAMQQNDNDINLIQLENVAQSPQIVNFTLNVNNASIKNMQLGGESNYIEHSINAKSKATELDAETSIDYKCEKQSTDMPDDGTSNATLRNEGDGCNSPEPKEQA